MTPTEKEWHELRQKCRFAPECGFRSSGFGLSKFLTCRCDILADQIFDEQQAAIERQRRAAR